MTVRWPTTRHAPRHPDVSFRTVPLGRGLAFKLPLGFDQLVNAIRHLSGRARTSNIPRKNSHLAGNPVAALGHDTLDWRNHHDHALQVTDGYTTLRPISESATLGGTTRRASLMGLEPPLPVPVSKGSVLPRPQPKSAGPRLPDLPNHLRPRSHQSPALPKTLRPAG